MVSGFDTIDELQGRTKKQAARWGPSGNINRARRLIDLLLDKDRPAGPRSTWSSTASAGHSPGQKYAGRGRIRTELLRAGQKFDVRSLPGS